MGFVVKVGKAVGGAIASTLGWAAGEKAVSKK